MKGSGSRIKRKYIYLLLLILVLLPPTYAQLTARANRLNYFNSENLTIVINWSGAGLANITATLPSGINFSTNLVDSTSVRCANESQINPSTVLVLCNSTNRLAIFQNVTNTTNLSFTVKNYTNHAEYLTSRLNMTAVDGPGTIYEVNITLIKIRDQEIFNTLIEYGRGRGNYFYSTTGGASSAGTGTGYPYVPNGTKFELNYLHKIFNIKQYYGLPTALAYNASWICIYPNNTMVRVHLSEAISRGAAWNITYKIPEIGGSFERQGFMGQQFDASETTVAAGNFYEVNCTRITYYLPDVNGNASVDRVNFTLQLRDPQAINITARPDQGTIGSGTTEVLVEYNITNIEVYPIEDVNIELQAPTYGTFIGTRGELFGTSLRRYIFRTQRMAANDTGQVFLIVRFNTTGASSGSTDLYRATVVSYIPSWEANAYNPLRTYQTIATAAAPNNITIDTATSARIIKLQDLFIDLNTTLRVINNTINLINSTVTAINATVNLINTTVTLTNSTVNEVKTTVNVINSTANRIDAVTVLINNTVNHINASINTMNDTITSIRVTLLLVNNTVTSINTTANLINNTVTVVNSSANTINGTVTNIHTTVGLINGTANSINATVNLVNNTVTSVNITVNLINGTANAINSTTLAINVTTNLINNTVTVMNSSINTINATLNSVINNQSIIVGKINRLQEFSEELIFLVTDSFGLRDQAIQQIQQGDVQGATESLRQANEKLSEAVDIISQRMVEAQSLEAPSPINPQLPGLDIIAMFSVLILIGVSGYLHYHKYPQNPQVQ